MGRIYDIRTELSRLDMQAEKLKFKISKFMDIEEYDSLDEILHIEIEAFLKIHRYADRIKRKMFQSKKQPTITKLDSM